MIATGAAVTSARANLANTLGLLDGSGAGGGRQLVSRSRRLLVGEAGDGALLLHRGDGDLVEGWLGTFALVVS